MILLDPVEWDVAGAAQSYYMIFSDATKQDDAALSHYPARSNVKNHAAESYIVTTLM